jgi:6-pyruvoyltetrahydropterin/6-carboxytetrahydropterin synthase
MLASVWTRLSNKFTPAALSNLTLKLNPFRKIAIEDGDNKMVYFSEKFEFAATHKLWNDKFSEQENLRVFGRCANPTGHGHNYTIEVTIKTLPDADFKAADFEKIVDAEVITLVDHKNLNTDVPEFGSTNPTVENMAVFAWSKLAEKLAGKLHCVTVWETDKTSCSFYGPDDKTP